jgi:hypothetical protein
LIPKWSPKENLWSKRKISAIYGPREGKVREITVLDKTPIPFKEKEEEASRMNN